VQEVVEYEVHGRPIKNPLIGYNDEGGSVAMLKAR
jgi:hypothetical protein